MGIGHLFNFFALTSSNAIIVLLYTNIVILILILILSYRLKLVQMRVNLAKPPRGTLFKQHRRKLVLVI